MAPILGYWDMRGFAEPIRYLLHYVGQDFEDKRYPFDGWHDEKYNLGLQFPNLPYYIDGDISLTQSNAILRHLARKYSLDGSTEAKKLRVDLVEQQIYDFRYSLAVTCYSPDFEKLKEEFIKNVPAQFKLFSAFLGDRKWLAGDSITYVDFMAYDTFDFYDYLIPGLIKKFPNIKDYMKRFESLPQLQDYLNSSTYKKWPIFQPKANFGGKGDEPKRE